MLSPHEFATLMLIKSAPEQIDPDRTDLEALLERQLVSLENRAGGKQRRASLTDSGDSILKAVERLRRA
jgi:hypothetical protein